jgi:phosphoribosylaminoimidazole-succinocarboxamide synthase
VDENGTLYLIDEVLTPDSSRFWPADRYEPGHAQASFDKQYVRDYLLSLPGFDKKTGVLLPEKVIQETREKYLKIMKIFTSE